MNGCFWKSAPQCQILPMEVIPEFYYTFKAFSTQNFTFSLKHDIFIIKNSFTVHIKWDVIISSSLRLLLKMWIWYRCQNRIKNYHHDGKQLGFYEKVHIKTQSIKKDVLVIFTLQETKNSNSLDKSCTQENVKFHIQHEGSWLRWIVIEQVIYMQP